jgi:hypothetical protein
MNLVAFEKRFYHFHAFLNLISVGFHYFKLRKLVEGPNDIEKN